MQTKQLGSTDLQVSPIVFGGNVFGWTLDEQKSHWMLDDLLSRGFQTIDTADVYSRWAEGNSGGESETIIGRWMAQHGNRDRITLISKVGHDMGQGHHDLSKAYILQACEDSLRRLQTDHIDLYFSHFDDPRTPVAETLEAYQELVTSGKVRYIGASNLSPERLRESLQTSRDRGLVAYQVLQPEYNLLERQSFEQSYAPICEEHQLGVITYYSLASGFLSGKYHSDDDLADRARGGSVEKYLHSDHAREVLRNLEDVSQRNDVPPAAVALAWVMANPLVTAPIASATRGYQLDAFEQALTLQLSEEDLNQLNEASRVG